MAPRFKELEAAIQARGYVIRQGRKHKGVFTKQGQRVATLPTSPSDSRSLDNMIRDLKRAGVLTGDPRKNGQRARPKEEKVASATAGPRIDWVAYRNALKARSNKLRDQLTKEVLPHFESRIAFMRYANKVAVEAGQDNPYKESTPDFASGSQAVTFGQFMSKNNTLSENAVMLYERAALQYLTPAGEEIELEPVERVDKDLEKLSPSGMGRVTVADKRSDGYKMMYERAKALVIELIEKRGGTLEETLANKVKGRSVPHSEVGHDVYEYGLKHPTMRNFSKPTNAIGSVRRLIDPEDFGIQRWALALIIGAVQEKLRELDGLTPTQQLVRDHTVDPELVEAWHEATAPADDPLPEPEETVIVQELKLVVEPDAGPTPTLALQAVARMALGAAGSGADMDAIVELGRQILELELDQ